MAILYLVGLGGAGSRVALSFARKYRALLRGEDAPVKVQTLDMAREKEVLSALEEGLLTSDDVGIIPAEIVERAKYRLAGIVDRKKWFPEHLKNRVTAELRGDVGVERRRPLARLLLHDPEVYNYVYTVLENDLRDLAERARMRRAESIVVVIASSLGGGFGSGVFQDIAAIIRDIEKTIRSKLFVAGVFIAPIYGGGQPPPPEYRTGIEEENSFAAIREMALLDALSQLGMKYKEQIGEKELGFGEAFDMVFLVSPAGVQGSGVEKLHNLDDAIADFIATLALIPATTTEASQSAGRGGLLISENLLKPKKELEQKLGIGANPIKPVMLSFSVVKFDLGVGELKRYFEVLSMVKDLEERLAELQRETRKLREELSRARSEKRKAEEEYEDCLMRWRRILERGIPPSEEEGFTGIAEKAEQILSRIESSPREYSGRTSLSGLITSMAPEVAKSDLDLYILLKELHNKLSSRIVELSERERELRESYNKLKSEHRDVQEELRRLSPFDRLFKTSRYKELKERSEELESTMKEVNEDIKKVSAQREALEKVQEIVADMLITRAPKSPEHACSELKTRIEEFERKVRELSDSIEDRMEEMKTVKDELEDARSEAERVLRESRVLRTFYLHFFGKEFLDKTLYEEWMKNPEIVEKLTLKTLRRLVGDRAKWSEALDRVVAELRFVGRPLLEESEEYHRCVGSMLRDAGALEYQDLASSGHSILLANPDDIDMLSGAGLRVSDWKPLKDIWGSITLVAIYPIVLAKCTREYRKALEEYCIAALKHPETYKMLHVFPVDELAEKLRERSVHYDPYLVTAKVCSNVLPGE